MTTIAPKPAWGPLLFQGLIAGIVGGILFNAFEYFSALAMTHHASMIAIWQYVASSVVHGAAYTSPNYAWLGLFLHACVAIAWAIGYAYVAATRPNVMAMPWLSGPIFGAVVWLAMDIVLLVSEVEPPISGIVVADGLIAHCIFYGIPVALTVRAIAKRA